MDMTDGRADHFYPNERWCTAPLRTHPVTLMNMRSTQTRRAPPVEKIVEIPASVESLVPPPVAQIFHRSPIFHANSRSPGSGVRQEGSGALGAGEVAGVGGRWSWDAETGEGVVDAGMVQRGSR